MIRIEAAIVRGEGEKKQNEQEDERKKKRDDASASTLQKSLLLWLVESLLSFAGGFKS